MASFYVQNFGCRATQADGAALERQLAERGLERAATPQHAQLVVLNTCTVTASADQDARAAIRRIHRENPGCQIVVTGCYAQRAPEEIAALPGVAQVIGNSHKHQLAELAGVGRVPGAGHRISDFRFQTSDFGLRPSSGETGARRDNASFVPVTDLIAIAESQGPTLEGRGLRSDGRGPTTEVRRPIFVSDIFAHTELLAAPVFDAANERTRPNLKIQDGCDNRCSFCVIPHVRGHSRSLPLADVLREVNVLVEAGYREVVISGINLGRWGRDLTSGVGRRTSDSGPPGRANTSFSLRSENAQPTTNAQGQTTFYSLVRTILDCTALEKLRISSVEPMDWTDSLIRLVAESPRIAKHAHVPMQSGSDRVLRAMHRKYRPWHYREKILKIREAMPTAAIGADVMVGFPGETDADFDETRCMVEELPFTYLHVFTYSPRPGTPAAALPSQVPVRVAHERNRILRELAGEKKLGFMRSFAGKTIEAITLHSCGGNSVSPYTEALTDNYQKLRLEGKYEGNQWIRARVRDVQEGTLLGMAL